MVVEQDDLGLELAGATVGVVGMGRIGRRYARMVAALGAQVVYSSRSPKLEAERALKAERLELPDLLSASDVVSIHAPSTEETHHLIGAEQVDLIGPGGVLVNTSRGPLVDELAVAKGLEEGSKEDGTQADATRTDIAQDATETSTSEPEVSDP